MPAEECLERLVTQRTGLGAAEAAARLERVGANRLPESKPRGLLARIAAQFNNVLIYVLIIAAAVSALLGHGIDAAVILLVVIANAGIGLIQEGRAEKALEAIKGMIAPRTSVLREGRRTAISAEEVVPGDMVLLEAGDRVPADLRLVRARNLRIDEAILTGESVPVEKSADPVEATVPLGDRISMAYSGTLVVAGQGLGVTAATGLSTELGRISALLESVETLATPLLRKINQFARQLTIFILAASAAVFLFATGLRSYPVAEAFMAAVALVVSAIPEGLPAVMTITLAIGVQKMAARHAIIRRLPAVETLGSVSVICSDKTGTLTRGEMAVQAAVLPPATVTVTGTGYEPRGIFERDGNVLDPAGIPALAELAKAAVLCNDATLRQAKGGWTVDGDPMEGALIAFAAKAGWEAGPVRKHYPRSDEIPFDSQYRFMATLHHDDQGAVIYVKGAPETVLARCQTAMGEEASAPIDGEHWEETVKTLAAKGYRVLALAEKRLPAEVRGVDFKDVESGLVLLGLAGLIDPPREEVLEAVAECRTAGIGIKMITGDHVITASAIARQLGLEGAGQAIGGERLERLEDDAFRAAAHTATVFARAAPEHKLRIVEALQAEGAVIAMTGDGVNDAPALKRADVGIAMGRKGTEAAKQAAEIVLADDNFASIVAAVKEGRTVYDNLEKIIGWTLPTNGGETLAIVAAILLGWALPVTPLQILWINTVTSVALGVTLAFEPPEPRVMRRPPRAPGEPILSGLLIWRILLVSVLFAVGAFGVFFWGEANSLPAEETRTIVVNVIVVMEIFYLFNVRSLYRPTVSWRVFLCTRAMLIGIAATLVAQALFTYAPPLQALFATRAMTPAELAAIAAIGIAVFLILEAEKWARWRLTRK